MPAGQCAGHGGRPGLPALEEAAGAVPVSNLLFFLSVENANACAGWGREPEWSDV